MNLQFIKYFITLAETQNFTQAAAKNFVVQSTFSSGIKKLETHFDCPLFYRDKRNVRLTNEGKALLPKARQLLTMWHHIENGFDNMERKDLKVGLLNNVSIEVILPRIHQFKAQYVDHTLSLSEGNEAWLTDQLHRGELDCVVMKEGVIDTQVFNTMFLYEARLMLALAAHHPLAHKRKVTLDVLHNLPFIERKHCTLFEDVYAALRQEQITPNMVFSSNNDEAVRGLIASGVGSSLMSKPLQPTTEIVYVPLEDVCFSAHIILVWKKGQGFSALERFIEA